MHLWGLISEPQIMPQLSLETAEPLDAGAHQPLCMRAEGVPWAVRAWTGWQVCSSMRKAKWKVNLCKAWMKAIPSLLRGRWGHPDWVCLKWKKNTRKCCVLCDPWHVGGWPLKTCLHTGMFQGAAELCSQSNMRCKMPANCSIPFTVSFSYYVCFID